MNILLLLTYTIIGTILIGVILIIARTLFIYLKNRSVSFRATLQKTLKSKRILFRIGTISFVILFILSLLIGSFFILFSRLSMSSTIGNSKVPSNQPSSLDELVKGKIGYDVPNHMIVGRHYWGTATISKSRNDSILLKGLTNQDFIIEEISIASRVKVVLLDPTENDNFKITPLNTVEQHVDASSNTVWKWDIIPINSGDNSLILRVTVKIIDELGDTYKDIKVFEKTIDVKSSIAKVVKDFLEKNWHFLLSTLILPLIIWLYKRKSSKKIKPHTITGFKPNNENNNS